MRLSIALIMVLFISIGNSLDETRCTVFDVGQGNCVLVEFNDQGLLIDAGSTKITYNAMYNKLFGYNEQRYRLVSSLEDTESYSESDSSELAASEVEYSSETDSEDEILTTPAYNKEKYPEKVHSNVGNMIESYRKSIVNSIRKKLKKLTSLTAVISHPDIDHYNFFPKIFNSTEWNNWKISSLILGGRYEQYKSTASNTNGFKNWLKILIESKECNVLFTGTHDGSRTLNASYARPFCSFVSPDRRSEAENKIVKALEFEEFEGVKPEVEILAMNAGHSVNPFGSCYAAYLDKEKNLNSIVLRIKGDKTAFITPGDADEITWNFILSYWSKGIHQVDNKRNYILLSHHGSNSDGACREDILKIFKPYGFFLSTGHGYNHPQQAPIELLEGLNCLGKLDKDYPLTYVKGDKSKIRCRKQSDNIFASTLDDGTFSFNLVLEGLFIKISRNRNKYDKEKGDSDILLKIKPSNFKGDKEDGIIFTKHSQKYNLLLAHGNNINQIIYNDNYYKYYDVKSKKWYNLVLKNKNSKDKKKDKK